MSREYTDTNYETYGTWEVCDNRYIFATTGVKKIYKSYDYMPIKVINSNGGCGGMLRLSYSGNILTLNISQVGTYDCEGLFGNYRFIKQNQQKIFKKISADFFMF
ncbi:MAG: hypothetical protein L6V93_17315 [Clostridiales bacterium]|nr:MAG: hypothetical protein L6V93_17315 [Clostridiales bacterium]